MRILLILLLLMIIQACSHTPQGTQCVISATAVSAPQVQHQAHTLSWSDRYTWLTKRSLKD